MLRMFQSLLIGMASGNSVTTHYILAPAVYAG